MAQSEIQTLEQRIAKLERQNRGYRYVGSLLAIFAVSMVLMGQANSNRPAKIVEAEKFVLRGPGGVVRGVFGIEKGIATVALADQLGKAVAELGAKNNGESTLVLADKTGITRVALGVRGDNSPDFGLADANGVLRLAMGIDAAGNPGLVLYDEKKNPIWKPIWRKP